MIADEFGCATIGIQYRAGVEGFISVSDLAEGMLNNAIGLRSKTRWPGTVCRRGGAYFNEVDECAGLAAAMNALKELGRLPENTLHDLRGRFRKVNGRSEYVFFDFGAAPPVISSADGRERR